MRKMRKQQLHKRFSQKEISSIIEKYLTKNLRAKEACRYLDIGRTRLYQLSVEYRKQLKQKSPYKEFRKLWQ